MTRLLGIFSRVWLTLLLSSAITLDSATGIDVQSLERSCEEFLARHDKSQVQRDYPKAIEDLLSGSRDEQLRGIRVLGATRELYILPWLVPILDAEDNEVRVMAGSSIEQVVSSVLLERRDRSRPEQIIIRPPEPGEVNLNPLSWVALKMIRSNEPNLSSYGATMAGYLGRRDFEEDLRRLLDSPHPAVQNAARYGLIILGLEEEP